MIELLSPIWGWGMAAAVGVPLLAHLLSQRGGRLAAFPSIRFVERAAADVARWLRPRHWLMLLLRMLILGLIAAAFMRPIWHRQAPATRSGEGIMTALVIDRSGSMTLAEGGVTLFEQAKLKAIETLEGLDPQTDRATVIVLDAAPRPLLPEPTAGFSNLIALVEQLEPTMERGDLGGAVRVALAETAEDVQATRDEMGVVRPVHIEIFSDLQRLPVDEMVQSMPMLADARLRTHAIGPADEPNLALHAPTVRPVRPIIGQMAHLSVEVSNLGGAATQQTVVMEYAGQRREQAVRLGPGGRVMASFPFFPTRLGPQTATVQFATGDTFSVDDETAATFIVDAARQVALVTDADVDDAHTAAFHFARALRPENEAAADRTVAGDVAANLPPDAARLSGVALARWRPIQLQAGLSDGGREQPDVIVIVEAPSLDTASLKTLHRYLEAGGAVLWVVDSPAAAAALAQFNALGGVSAAGGSAPIVPDAADSWRAGSNLAVATGAFDDDILSVFEGPARSAVVNLRFESTLAGKAPTVATVLWTFEDGTPALAASWLGSGRLAVLAADAAPAKSQLVKGPVLVSLIHQVLRHLSPGPPAEPNPHPGMSPTLTIDGTHDGSELVMVGPDNEPRPVTVIATQGADTIVQLPRLDTLGRYDVRQRGRDGNLVAAVQVELDPTESDLNRADATTVAALQIDGGAMPAAGGTARGAEAQLLRPAGVDLWPWLMLIAIVLIAAEPVIVALLGGPNVGGARVESESIGGS